eukprot:scaffold44362_cov25-Tisochrysis_lutea.AAC.1
MGGLGGGARSGKRGTYILRLLCTPTPYVIVRRQLNSPACVDFNAFRRQPTVKPLQSHATGEVSGTVCD